MMPNEGDATTAGVARWRWLPLVGALALALVVRLMLWGNLPRTGFVSDEGEYLAAAAWLAEGRGFSWHEEWLWTRAPLYPLFLAAHVRLFGLSLTPIYLTQTLLGLAQITLTFLLAERIAANTPWRRAVPAIAATLTALFFPLAIYNQVLLSESLYIALVLGALLALAHWAAEQRARYALALLIIAGALAGLATLTRGLAIGFAPLAAA
ncbi:MAG: glycosyltransferase family 39 protein, partial [Chloroflexales bacterium]|nr:glycosyltransferase family 39 protein [Chloroflexales bacterium]